MLKENINIKGYHHIFDSQCFKKIFEETIVDLYTFQSSEVAKSAKKAVQQYYDHVLNNPFHKSKSFSKEFVEHFGTFTGSNIQPYTTSNTASSHKWKHLKCVQGLIQGLQLLSNAVNSYIKRTYPALYKKIKKLDLGPNILKPFGAFPTVGS
ncbi:9447_t:CDS:1 [Gigaspora rosea]|nr:9447_t:CDS:1 [Gigaspora rosea]